MYEVHSSSGVFYADFWYDISEQYWSWYNLAHKSANLIKNQRGWKSLVIFSGGVRKVSLSRIVWEYNLNSGDKHLPRLNTDKIPIENKYREGKLKSALIRGWNSTWSYIRSIGTYLFHIRMWCCNVMNVNALYSELGRLILIESTYLYVVRVLILVSTLSPECN